MSHVLYKSTNLVVQGYSEVHQGDNILGISEEKSHWLSLDLIIQVNGRMHTHFVSYQIIDHESRWLTLDNWKEWTAISELLRSLGYEFPERGYTMMEKWIDEIYTNKPEWVKFVESEK